MDLASISRGGDPGVQICHELSTEQSADNLAESLSSAKTLQNTGDSRDGLHVDACSCISGQSETDPELAGLDTLEDGRPGERPAYPFTTLIRYAIKGSPSGRLLLEDIYNAIQSRYPYFTTAPSGWKNSVRHTLSLMTCFEKVPRLLTEPGKGSYWTVNDSMPHAKPSRVRIRKRKTRTDDEGVSPGTPRSVPDAPHLELSGGESLSDSNQHQRLFPYDYSGSSARRHSSYVPRNVDDQLSRYNYKVDILHSYHDNSGGRWVRNGPLHAESEKEHPVPELGFPHGLQSIKSWQEVEHPEDSTTKEMASEPINYRLMLMSDLEKMRDALGRRDDIDDEWCRVMVERIRGTGLV
ncbi:Forkhead box protein J2 [Rhizoctonia solani]|uniref:Forkhead box protein J2 n=1 Tax=Rhizoctonia solani TaxID=456999 RepID=A0A0K6G6K4_9AGAM|nr:Forkhead box protein J2 [Rhizoctonia solani]